MAAALLVALLGAAPADAARKKASKVRAVATLSSCKADSVVLRAALDGGRRVRGATLSVVYQAVPLIGDLRSTPAVRLGKKRKVVISQELGDLPASTWAGVVRFRWKRGRRVLASGFVRTRSAKVGRRRGRGFCTLGVGRPPRDERPPSVSIFPAGGGWTAAPLAVHFIASDDLSGVDQVFRQVNGGPVESGRQFALTAEGSHTIVYAARDRAGNASAPQSATLLVDGGPPTQPVITRPFSVTESLQPVIAWEAATDSGSGVQSYAVAVRDAAGTVVAFRQVPASILSVSIDEGLPAGSYEAQVYAVDATAPQPFVSASEPRSFRIDDSSPRVTGSTPADGIIVPLAEAGADISVTFDRPMDPETVTAANVGVTRDGAEASVEATVTCDDPCITATIDPAAALPEGLYDITVTEEVLTEEGGAIEPYSARFSIPFYENDIEIGCQFNLDPPWDCGTFTNTLPTRVLGTPSPERSPVVRTAHARSPQQSLTFDGDTIAARVTRLYRTSTSDDCQDSAAIRLRLDGTPTALEAFTAPAPAETKVYEVPGLSGTRAVQFEFELVLDDQFCGEDPPADAGLYLDDLQLARKP